MIHELVYRKEEEVRDKICPLEKTDKSPYNSPPFNFQSTSLELLISKYGRFFIYSPHYREYRQFFYRGKLMGFTLFHYDDKTGYAYHRQYLDGVFSMLWFIFGCDHSYKELTQKECRERNIIHCGRCYHVCECSKCLHIWSYDSSG